ncbi:hypothetical protein FKM82_018495 [Ascaphus truei]
MVNYGGAATLMQLTLNGVPDRRDTLVLSQSLAHAQLYFELTSQDFMTPHMRFLATLDARIFLSTGGACTHLPM